ncbi:HAD family hydrolase [Rhodococcus ruber Chol-4]|uniref:HAD-IIA family hydrolase n=1 Tax=Rhodococcus TaxID=1827 RepID=UPI000299DC06|nr:MULTISPECIES: HAD-IIA family hydrolase [Rhodococcus]MDO2377936.1 HAD-IIA family hydrolase [Rhodococcus ruber]RIK11086.1 MAG: HAD-IIA family hydrolase [Acidobacteriota bacterium]ATQ28922.1 TIGR01458 family HAD-type hydrolase [Rhodococcus ruber]AUM17953.1 TIGR01458 family HAD-type hydrolase [Rhodococcus ruber]AWH00345.1 HAD-IIA family hydrolase [Rhodococcus ruber]
MAGVDGVLFDIEGVIVTSWVPVPGAAEVLAGLRERGVHRAFLTNTTSRTCAQIAETLSGLGMPVEPAEIVTAASLTAEYLRQTYPDRRCWVLNHGDVEADLAGIVRDEDDPEVVVLGGAGPEFSHRALSRVAELMLDGVPVVAMHRGATWQAADGLHIDTGVYLPGLEELSGQTVVAVGKPSMRGFLAAAELMGTEPDRMAVVGDDLHAEVIPGQRLGMTGILVRTGKFRQSVLDLAVERPDRVIDSVADLPELLDTL